MELNPNDTIISTHIPLSKWFPGNDPIAAVVARLCILRENYLPELQGLIKKDYNPFDVRSSVSEPDSLDGNSPSRRRLYFFRNSLRALNEIRNAGEKLFVEGAHKVALTNETLQLLQAFEMLRDEISGLSTVIKDLRDRIGGHVLREGVQDALRGLDPGRNRSFRDGRNCGRVSYPRFRRHPRRGTGFWVSNCSGLT